MKKILSFPLAWTMLLLVLASCKRDSGAPGNNGGDTGGTASSRVAANAPQDELVTTVANIIVQENGDIEYNFNERAAGYFVSKTNPAYNEILAVAREAQARRMPVKLYASEPGGLTRLSWPTAAETSAYQEWYKYNILNAEPNRRLNISQINPAVFNLADWQNWKVFRLCVKLIPDFATAKQIFDYCKQQTCTFGPTQEQPCIPFQYVRDGCFARAHKMRKIIEEKYRYCSEKVFSYGYGSTLWVQATLSGGCCVNWWYHVAPVVRVKSVAGGSICYVIDPGMFTQPVTLSTWLSVQANTICNGAANLSSYSIQPSSVYTPVYANPVTQYTTDPGYVRTNTDLVNYANVGTTCGN